MTEEKAKRTERMTLRLSRAELAALRRAAAAAGVEVAAFARQNLMAGAAPSAETARDPGRETSAMAASLAAALAPIFAAHRKAQTAELESLFAALKAKFIPRAITAAGGTPPNA